MGMCIPISKCYAVTDGVLIVAATKVKDTILRFELSWQSRFLPTLRIFRLCVCVRFLINHILRSLSKIALMRFAKNFIGSTAVKSTFFQIQRTEILHCSFRFNTFQFSFFIIIVSMSISVESLYSLLPAIESFSCCGNFNITPLI